MSKKPTDLDDIADAINGLATLMDKRFEQVDQRFNVMDLRFDRLETEQAKTRQWLERIDNRLKGMESDV